ncbi:MAG: HPr family phosphocarrier protein [Oscillospiraceae bacterium]
MKLFEYTIKDKLGLHARPAGLLVKCISAFQSDIKLTKSEKTVDAKRLFGVMGMAIKCGDIIIISIDGPDEELAFNAIKLFCEETI